MNELLPPGSQLFIDASVCAVAALRYMAIEPPSEIHNAFNMEPMGWAPAAVVGAALGAPDDVCVSLSGDGGFLMNGNEVSTAAQYGIGAVWVVHYNNTLAAVEVNLQQEFPGDGWMDLYKLGAPNLVDSPGVWAPTPSKCREAVSSWHSPPPLSAPGKGTSLK
jgi:acetolactate synthase I/II/III large subunit